MERNATATATASERTKQPALRHHIQSHHLTRTSSVRGLGEGIDLQERTVTRDEHVVHVLEQELSLNKAASVWYYGRLRMPWAEARRESLGHSTMVLRRRREGLTPHTQLGAHDPSPGPPRRMGSTVSNGSPLRKKDHPRRA